MPDRGRRWFVVAAFGIFLLAPGICRADADAARDETLHGMVVDGTTHDPVEGARVRLVETGSISMTDRRGLFLFEDLPAGRYTLEVTRIGYRRTVANASFETEHDTALVLIHLFVEPISTGAVVVTGVHRNTRFEDISPASSEISGQDLQRELGQTLAATLRNETGLAVRSMGPAPARPVVRGMTGDRIVISEDGLKTQDLSATSPDHAVTVEPFTADRIEVTRGPATLQHTSTTIGGVVNVVRTEIPETIPERVVVAAGGTAETASKGDIVSGTLTVPLGHVIGRGEYSYKRSSDLRTPAGTLPNTYGKVHNASLGAGYVDGWGYAGGALREFEMRYGVPGGFVGAHPDGVDIELLRRTYAVRGSVHIAGDLLDKLTASGSRTYYHHTEYEKSGAIGAEFVITSYAAALEAQHTPLGDLTYGTWGVSFESRDFSVGGFVFTPPTLAQSISVFGVETLNLGRLELQGGVRIGFDRLRPREEDPDAAIGPILPRDFSTLSLSALGQYTLSDSWHVGLTFSRTSRVPTIEELYSEGPHLAAYSYEVGNPLLEEEHGYGGEAFFRYRRDGIQASLTGFTFNLPSYIIAQNTGEINYATLLPIYATTGVSARLTGIEGEFAVSALEHLTLAASLSYTVGANRTSGYPLPAIPPLKSLIDIRYQISTWTFGVSSELAAAQSRVDEFEEPTAGYGVLNLYLQTVLFTGPVVHNISLMLDNVADTEYRNHLSRVKSIAPEAGRNLRFVYRLTY